MSGIFHRLGRMDVNGLCSRRAPLPLESQPDGAPEHGVWAGSPTRLCARPPKPACPLRRSFALDPTAPSGLRPINTFATALLSLADVTVTTAHGPTATFPSAVLFMGRPHILGLAPIPGARPCISSGAAALTRCAREGAAFAIFGTGLLSYGRPSITVGPFHCPNVTASDTTHLTCQGLQGQVQTVQM